jgi:hypothetical protein
MLIDEAKSSASGVPNRHLSAGSTAPRSEAGLKFALRAVIQSLGIRRYCTEVLLIWMTMTSSPRNHYTAGVGSRGMNLRLALAKPKTMKVTFSE